MVVWTIAFCNNEKITYKMLEEMEKEKEERDRVRQRNRAAQIQANAKNEKTKDDKAE